MPEWTIPQKNAINARGSNILVSAAAGSGKTAVLVERVIKLITDPTVQVDIDKLLIVTFTNAAAAEMKARIAKALYKIISEDPNNTNAHRQLSLLPSANVCTIDSFCINLVRENFFKLSIEQDFQIMENSEKQMLQTAVLEELIEELYCQNDDEFKILVEMLSSTKNDEQLANTIIKISDYINAQEFPNKWLDEACELYNPNVELKDSECAKYVYNETLSHVKFAFELIDNSRNCLSVDDPIFKSYSEMLDSDYEVFSLIQQKALDKDWDSIVDIVNNVKFSRMPSIRGYESPAKSIVANNRDLYKKYVLSDMIAPLYSLKEDDYKEDCLVLYRAIKKLVEIVKLFNFRLLEAKRELNSYTFSDIEHFAIELLFHEDDMGGITRTDLALEYQKSFIEILVDEYQDTNSAQDRLFEMLSNGKNRFMVGDVKQSIYRFRLAMPFIFNNKKNEYDDYSEKNKSDRQKVILSNNFRSREGICKYVNFVFSKIMSERVGELDYNDDEMLNYSANYKSSAIPCAQLNFVQTPEDEDAAEFEAEQIAQYIIEKINSDELVFENDEYRRISYADFAILLRTAKNMNAIASVFSKYGIPTIANNKVNLFDNSEVTILINLLRIIDNPIQDVPMLATLMSVFYGYSADDIAGAKMNNNARNLYSSIANDSKFYAIVADLKRYREYAASMSVENMIRQIISETSYLSVISAMGNHEQRIQNVMLLVDLARKFDNGENVGLTAFIRYLDTIIENKFNVESANVASSNKNAVSIMTIHHSKGLEFPIVILADSCHKYNRDEINNSLIQLNSKVGIGLKVHNEAGLYRYNSLQYSVIRDINHYALMSENLRVLYVAMTRAKEQFVTFVSKKDVASYINSISKKITGDVISPAIVKKIDSDADLLALCALLHKDGKLLREFVDEDISIVPFGDFDLSISILQLSANNEVSEVKKAEVNGELLNEIAEKLSFKYDRLVISNYSSKRTASSLDEKEQDFKYLTSSRPAFLSKNNATSAQKGTAMHAFMQFCDYESAKESVDSEVDRLVSISYLTKEQGELLDRAQLEQLFNSDFAKRMFNSDKIYREIKVSSFVPVCELEDTDYNEPVLVQGIADCVFEENGELVVVDYKTDDISSEDELMDRYKNQVGFYKMAIEKTLKKPVKEALLYSFKLNKVCIYK